MPVIAPSILSADFARLGDHIAVVEQAGAQLLHVDVMDGHFVPQITIGPPVVRAISAVTNLPLDVHLMIENPDRFIQAFIDAGAYIITVHQEACPHLDRVVNKIKKLGGKAGVALNPATPLHTLDEILLELDLVLIMSVNPGAGGQPFVPYATQKIRRLRAYLDAQELQADLEVDGGIKAANIRLIADAGASILVAGSSVYSEKIDDQVLPPDAAYRRLAQELARTD